MAKKPFRELKSRLQDAHFRHRHRFGDQVTELTRSLGYEHSFQVDLLLSGLRSFKSNFPDSAIAEPCLGDLREYLDRMQWVIWGDCELGPPIGLDCCRDEVALGVLAYLSARLMDDAIDGHLDYKGRMCTFFGKLSESRSVSAAAEAGTLAGSYLLNESLRHLSRRGYRDSARMIGRIYSEVFAGALAEALHTRSTGSHRFYQAVVEHKAVAYDRMLHQVFFRTASPPLRRRILELLAEHSRISQWLNDCCDEHDDRQRGQLSLLQVKGMDRARAFTMVLESLTRLFEATCRLPETLSDSFALRLLDSIMKFEEEDQLEQHEH